MANSSSKSKHNQVAYQPLTNLGAIEETDLELEEELNEVIAGGQGNETHAGLSSSRTHQSGFRKHHSRPHSRWSAGSGNMGLRQLRTILLILAAVLSLVFILKLATYSKGDVAQLNHQAARLSAPIDQVAHRLGPPSSVEVKLPISAAGQTAPIIAHNSALGPGESSQQLKLAQSPTRDKRPEYDNYLSSIIYERDHKAETNGTSASAAAASSVAQQQLDDFRISLGDGRSLTRDDSDDGPASRNYAKWWSVQLSQTGRYATVASYIRAMKSFHHNSSVTFATYLALDSDSFHHTLELCERWDGPVSVALYLSRGLDELPMAISLIKFARQCLPAPLSACMRDKLTWHLVFALEADLAQQASNSNRSFNLNTLKDSLSYPKYHLDAVHYSSFANTDQCPKLAAAEAPELIKHFQLDIMTKNKPPDSRISNSDSSSLISKTTRRPLNMLRNVAQAAVGTKFVLVAPVDLYPSFELATRFIDLVQASQMHSLDLSRSQFVLPAFEMNHRQQQLVTPKTKRKLVDLIITGKVALFQEPNCDRCHEFPYRKDWLQEAESDSDNLTIFKEISWISSSPNSLARRWQPFYIATAAGYKPHQYFNEDQLQSRIDITFESCLLNYRMFLLSNGFLFRNKISNLKYDEKPGELATNSIDLNRLVQNRLTELKLKYKDSANINIC